MKAEGNGTLFHKAPTQFYFRQNMGLDFINLGSPHLLKSSGLRVSMDASHSKTVSISVRKSLFCQSILRLRKQPISSGHGLRAHLRAKIMQTGGNMLGGGVTAEHMTLQDLGQVVSSHICKIPNGKNVSML